MFRRRSAARCNSARLVATVPDAHPHAAVARKMLNKVPEVTLYFWVIKVLCTTVGETASDYLATNLSLGLTKTTFITGALLLVTLFFQFRLRRYVAGVYWFAVVLISVVGTQITDNLTDNFGVSLVTTTIVFSVILAIVFAVWYASERTLSIRADRPFGHSRVDEFFERPVHDARGKYGAQSGSGSGTCRHRHQGPSGTRG